MSYEFDGQSKVVIFNAAFITKSTRVRRKKSLIAVMLPG